MHLNECFALAFHRQEEHLPPSTDLSPFRDEMSLLDFPGYPQHVHEDGSVSSVLKCIALDWVGKSKTVFHIPKEYLSGYTYLFEGESDPKKRHSLSARGHRSPTFVNAGNPNNLHPHNYTTFSNGSRSIAHSSAWFLTDSRMNVAPPKDHRPSLPITTPYFHPDTDIPGER